MIGVVQFRGYRQHHCDRLPPGLLNAIRSSGKADKELRYTPFKALGKVDQLLVRERHTLRKFVIDVPSK